MIVIRAGRLGEVRIHRPTWCELAAFGVAVVLVVSVVLIWKLF